MNKLTQAAVAVGLLVGLAAPAPATPGETLNVGDPAPALSVGEWVKGDAVQLQKGHVYLIEFWATW